MNPPMPIIMSENKNMPTEEPSVLDYVKALLIPWRGTPPKIPPLPKEGVAPKVRAVRKNHRAATSLAGIQWATLPWRTLAALFLVLLAQISLELPTPSRLSTLGPYVIAIGLMLWAHLSGEWTLTTPREQEDGNQHLRVISIGFTAGVLLAGLAYLTFGGNHFTPLNIFFWGAAFILIVWALWVRAPQQAPWLTRLRTFLVKPSWSLPITRFGLLIAAALAISFFFRIYQLSDVPRDMFSDHIEKLMDIYDVRNGQKSIYFPRNTGREAGQMYLTSWIIDTFNTGYSFLSLKLGMVAAGIFMLPYMYFLGKEISNREVGLIAMFLTGVAFWPNILARVGLRHILYPAFVAPTLYYLVRGLRRGNRNDFILSGIALGIGLHGYSPIRVLPFVLVLAVVLFLLHKQSLGVRIRTIIFLGVLALMALIVFLPLLRFAIDEPSVYNYRTLTRVGILEQPYPGSPVVIFFQNLWDALLMINVTNSSAWAISIPNRPMLDFISASLFILGVFMLIVRYARKRHWLDLFLLLSIPMLMMPSILSLAFPVENPTANRAGGAMVPVFIIAALAMESIIQSIRSKMNQVTGTRLAGGLAVLLVGWAALLNYNLTFNTFAIQFSRSAWNSSEMGAVISQFAETIGSKDSAWVVAYPHWADNRLVAINAGLPPGSTYELFPENFQVTLDVPAPKMFLVKLEDVEGMQALQELYPEGITSFYESEIEYEVKDFYIFFVPPEGEQR